MQNKKKMHDEQNIYILYKDRISQVEPSWSLKEKKKSIILILDFCTLLASPKPHPWEAESGFEPKAILMVLCLSITSLRKTGSGEASLLPAIPLGLDCNWLNYRPQKAEICKPKTDRPLIRARRVGGWLILSSVIRAVFLNSLAWSHTFWRPHWKPVHRK